MEDQKNQQSEEKTLEERVRVLEERMDHQTLITDKLDRLVYKLFRRAKRQERKPAEEATTA